MTLHRLSLVLLTLTLLSAGLLSADAAMNVGARRALLGGKAAAPAPPLTPCTSTGIYDLSNVCNDIYFIGALR